MSTARATEGLTVGVTATRPELMRSTPARITEIPSLWAVGFDGAKVAKVSGGEPKFTNLKPEWNPRDLQRGDEVRLWVLDAGCSTSAVCSFSVQL